MSKKCPYCEKEYPEVSRYCPYCGSPNPSYKKPEEQKMNYVRQIILFFVGFIGFQIIGTLLQIPFVLKAQSDFPGDNQAILNYLNSPQVSMFVNALAYCIIFSLLLFIAMPGLNNLFKSFKNKKSYLGAIIAIACIYAFNIFYSVILALFNVKADSNNNQQALDSVIKVYPIISIIVFGVLGPVCEELTYRVGLFDFVKRKNRILAYVITIVVFTLIHFDFAASNIVNELINVPYYAGAAFAFTFVFDRFGFSASVTAHIFNNLISVFVSMF